MSLSEVRRSNNLVQISSKESLIRQQLEKERSRLEQEAGIVRREIQHFQRPVERLFTKSRRDTTTILFSGFTWKHDKLIQGALESLGYKCEAVPVPDKKAFQLGKEYGNNGQCNPPYFTVGNLVQFVQSLEEKGLTKQEIIDRDVFLTAGACGPCRFGMYEAEYRLALRNAGFEGFRVLLFQEEGGLNQAEAEAGLEMNLDFFLNILNALNIGDVVNDVGNRIRPFEINAGETDRVLDESMDMLQDVMRRKRPWTLEANLAALLSKTNLVGTAEYLGKFLNQLYGDDYTATLNEVRDRFNAIPLDRTRVKPIVKVTGEFWAQTTEGDGNFNMFAFLEREGAQVWVEPIGCWVTYLLSQALAGAQARKGLDSPYPGARWWEWKKQLANDWKFRKKWLLFGLSEWIWNRQHARTARHLGGLARRLAPQSELARMAHPFYHSLARGGEGHLEVGKNVYYTTHRLCHMVLALKPFGCMPSSQSDGVQSAVVNRFRDMIFIPIETSGEGEINAHSRVQMALGEAKSKAKAEFEQALASTGKKLDEIQAYAAEHRQLRSPFYPVPQRQGVTGVAANFVLHVSNLIDGKARLAKLPGEI